MHIDLVMSEFVKHSQYCYLWALQHVSCMPICFWFTANCVFSNSGYVTYNNGIIIKWRILRQVEGHALSMIWGIIPARVRETDDNHYKSRPEIWTQDLLNMPFSTSALDGDEWLASCPCRNTPRERATGTHWLRWLSQRACLDAVELRNSTLVPRP
jgi:hypothetical protein